MAERMDPSRPQRRMGLSACEKVSSRVVHRGPDTLRIHERHDARQCDALHMIIPDPYVVDEEHRGVNK